MSCFFLTRLQHIVLFTLWLISVLIKGPMLAEFSLGVGCVEGPS